MEERREDFHLDSRLVTLWFRIARVLVKEDPRGRKKRTTRLGRELLAHWP
jgi:hypothetical protein